MAGYCLCDAECSQEALEITIEPGMEAGAEAAPLTTRIYAEGICCPSEVPLIHRILEPMAGVSLVGIRAKSPPLPAQGLEPTESSVCVYSTVHCCRRGMPANGLIAVVTQALLRLSTLHPSGC